MKKFAILVIALLVFPFSVFGQQQGVPSKSDQAVEATPQKLPQQVDAALHARVVEKGVQYLISKGQDPETGSFSKQLGPAVTSMCVTALIRNGVSLKHESVVKGLDYIKLFIREDGGIYAKGSALRNYETSFAVLCLHEANKNGEYDQTIQKAVLFLKGIQWDAGEGHPLASPHFGGQGYGSHKRPDLSNTSTFLDALKAASEDPSSEAMQNALKFVSRTQNLSTEHNRQGFAAKAAGEDVGGFIYTPVGPETKAGDAPTGGLRSYASMTYAGLKSFLYAGLKKDDVRVKAAMDWIQRHYDLDSNPGMGQQGLFYYYNVFARALDVYGARTLVDTREVVHNWRADLTKTLAAKQQADGSWVNPADRWYEGDANLVTSYALMALSFCHPDRDK